jgi:hypothetical protein
MPEAFEPVGERIEKIGQRHAGDEREQRVAQNPDQQDEDDQRPDPEQHLPLQIHWLRPSQDAMCRIHAAR